MPTKEPISDWCIGIIGFLVILLAAYMAISVNEKTIWKENKTTMLTKEGLQKFHAGEIFRTVTTSVYESNSPLKTTMVYVCVIGKSGDGWSIKKAQGAHVHPDDVARYGATLEDEQEIKDICPCDEEAFSHYQH